LGGTTIFAQLLLDGCIFSTFDEREISDYVGDSSMLIERDMRRRKREKRKRKKKEERKKRREKEE
jgi:hypothetical protein